MTATSYRFVSIGITVQGGTNKKIKKKKKIKIKKETRGRGGCVSSRESGRFLWRGPYVYRGSTDQWAVRHCLTHVLVARARACVCWVLTVIQLAHGFVGPRIFLICRLECTPSGAILCDYSFGRYLKVEPRALLWGGLEIELNL